MKSKKSAASIVVRRRGGPRDKSNRQNKYLSPDYIVGFVDGEGCFCISVSRHKEKKTGYDVKLEFEIELRGDDRRILERIKNTLGCGHLYQLDYSRYGWRPHIKYKVNRLIEFSEKIIPFFTNHPLQAKKSRIFKLFCQVHKIMKEKQHLTQDGIRKILKIRKKIQEINKKGLPRRQAG